MESVIGGVRMRVIRVLAPCLLLLACSACAIRIADLNAISTRNVNLDRVDLDSLEGEQVEGKSSGFWFLIFPLSFPSLQDAVDEALDKGGGDLMTDAVVHSSGWWFLIGQHSVSVKGTVVKTRGANKGDG